MAQSYQNILSVEDINYILALPEVILTKNKLAQNGAIKFTIGLPESAKRSLEERLGINLKGLTEIPMRWIKGDTAPHIDLGDKFLNTYLVYLNDSPGELVFGSEHYPIKQNTGYIFNEGLNHETVNTGTEPRLMIGPMSENAIAVGVVCNIIYYSTEADALANINSIACNSTSFEVGHVDSGSGIGTITNWVIASNSTGTSIGIIDNGSTLNNDGFYYLFPAPTPPSFPSPPYSDTICVAPPYNATNFTPANAPVYSTLVSYAKNAPNYPWNTGTDAQQIFRSQQNVTYFNNMNLQTQSIRTQNNSLGPAFNIPYPQFKTQAERIMYIQGQALTAARNIMTGQNPSAPAGVPCSTIYEIIYS
jgi:hypothetical protein